MKEDKILTYIGIQASLILANTSEHNFMFWFWGTLALIYAIKFSRLTKKD